MAQPMSAAQFLAALRAEGLTVVEVGDWEHHNRAGHGAWGPVHGVMIHHTVTKGTAYTVELCRKGHPDLPGPLCHGVIAKDGAVYLVGYGRANHAGSGDDDVLTAVIAERPLPPDNEANTDGNRHFYGFECENLGDGHDPWPAAQLEAIERVSAAIARHHAWSERSVIRHLDWQPGKVDPRGIDWPAMQARIADRLTHPAAAGSTSSEELESMNQKDAFELFWDGDVAPAPSTSTTIEKNPTWKPINFLREIFDAVTGLRAEVAALRADVAELKKGA